MHRQRQMEKELQREFKGRLTKEDRRGEEELRIPSGLGKGEVRTAWEKAVPTWGGGQQWGAADVLSSRGLQGLQRWLGAVPELPQAPQPQGRQSSGTARG